MKIILSFVIGISTGLVASWLHFQHQQERPGGTWVIKRSDLKYVQHATELVSKYPDDQTYTYSGGDETSLKIVCTAIECAMRF